MKMSKMKRSLNLKKIAKAIEMSGKEIDKKRFKVLIIIVAVIISIIAFYPQTIELEPYTRSTNPFMKSSEVGEVATIEDSFSLSKQIKSPGINYLAEKVFGQSLAPNFYEVDIYPEDNSTSNSQYIWVNFTNISIDFYGQAGVYNFGERTHFALFDREELGLFSKGDSANITFPTTANFEINFYPEVLNQKEISEFKVQYILRFYIRPHIGETLAKMTIAFLALLGVILIISSMVDWWKKEALF